MSQSQSIEKLIIHDIVQDLPCTFHSNYEYHLSDLEVENLCKVASILSLNKEAKDQALAYEIITKLFKNFHTVYPNLYSVAHAILSRLGNFPNRTLLDRYGFTEINLYQSAAIKLEIIARQIENSVHLKERNSLLTDFQKTFFTVLTKEHFYSVSAPTSAGKSFIFTLSIIQRFFQNQCEKIVLIVPTRALIRELSEKILKSLKEYDLMNCVNVRTVPIIEEDNASKGVVYVLTQERLNTLLNEESLHLDTIFIDEAQEIQSNRGVVLQNTLELLLHRFSNINLFFASPLIENPSYFSELLELNCEKNSFIEEVSPVGQNIIFLSSIKKKQMQAKVNLLNNDQNIDLGILDLDFNFRQNGQIIDFALSITKNDELTLIYCNGAVEAEEKALKMATKISKEVDDDIRNLIQFILEDVHESYSLIECLKKGVAYHYSHIPTNVRTEIEKLASGGKLQYVFCTSTLLQGVNLPTKNIILYNPSKGRGKPMKRSDFLNLIGRAGRLQKEFQGNIWCIEPAEWQEKCYEGNNLQTIELFYTKVLLDQTDKILEIAIDENSNNMDVLSVFGKFYSDYIIDNKSLAKYENCSNFDILNKIYGECQNYNLELSCDLIKKHYSIHPKKLNALYNFFMNENELVAWVPQNVFKKKKTYPHYEDGTFERLSKIFKIIDEIFLNKTNTQYKKFTVLAMSWIHDNLLKEIIENNHKYNLEKEPNRTINTTIREVLEILEKRVRFEYVVYTSAYLDILKYVMEKRKINYDFENIPNLPLHLECGSADSLVINLISLGLSRLTSIKLKKSKYFSCDDPTATNCFLALQRVNINQLDIPFVCKQEIKSLID